ncbi:MAG: VOC family protein [Castellaniella sp.]|uniref:VOC family protein n=1 Tax=Castellaniella sp. TaxID=1955812 RepID=UPI003C78EEF9
MALSPDGTAQVQPIPSDMNTVTPHLVCADAASAVDFYGKAFGATVMARLDAPQGGLLHACLRIGDSAVMLMEESAECQSVSPMTLKGTPVTIHLYVRDVDAAFRQAVEAGATSLMEPQDMFWGDRYGVLRDPYGHQWAVATHVRDLDPDAIRQAAAAMFASQA